MSLKRKVEELPQVDYVKNPGIIIPLSGSRLVVHNRENHNWVVSREENSTENCSRGSESKKDRSNYGLIERVCDYLDFGIDFGWVLLARGLVERLRQKYSF